jgi:GTP pyrophosphokinase
MTPILITSTDGTPSTPFVDESRLLCEIAKYLAPGEVEHVAQVLELARELWSAKPQHAAPDAAAPRPGARARWDFGYVTAMASALVDTVQVDAVSLGAVLLYQAVELRLIGAQAIRERLGGDFGEQTAQLIESIERFDALQRPAAARRRAADREADADPAAPRVRRRERQRRDEAEAIRKMFVGMAEDPRVVIFKIADHLRTMRAAREAAVALRARAGQASAAALGAVGEIALSEEESAVPEAPAAAASDAADGWTLDECLALAHEARTLYAPLAGRLGIGRMESELEDLAFAVLEPDEYRWLSEAVAEEKHQRSSYVARVCAILREEIARLGIPAEVSGRVKHLYSIYRKVERAGSHDISDLYDIVAFRIIVKSVADCYVVLGHVHQLWKPKDGRIKDFIASPKPNGYQSLHTTVFCLDDRMAEIQIRTREMHQVAEYGVAMHWHYKEVGDSASAVAAELERWVSQVVEWQQELQQHLSAPTPNHPTQPTRSDEQIYVFTPAGDPKELPAGSTPLDFAYRVHSNVGEHCAGARVTTDDGQLVTRMVPLDYELKNGDTVEIITQKNAHPTRDWLRVARTKNARTHILRYLKAHERNIDQQIGKDRLDHELKLAGVRSGIGDMRDDDLLWAARELGQPDVESLLVAIGNEKVRPVLALSKLRERVPQQFPQASEPHEAPAGEDGEARATVPTAGVDVAGVGGLFTRLASCCSPVPGDAVSGFITRGRGVVVHRADCPNLAAMVKAEPERAVPVSLADLDGAQGYFVPIVVQASDRPGLLADVTGVISRMKINMSRVTTITNAARHTATITAILELNRADQLEQVTRQLLGVKSVLNVERKRAGGPRVRDGKAGGRAKAH